MNDKTIFSGARFLATLRRDLTMERNGWMLRIFAMLGMLVALQLICQWCFHGGLHRIDPYVLELERKGLGFICLCTFSVFTILGASQFCQGYTTPGRRLNQLMNPASTLEKYASRFVICIIGVTLAFVVCWYAADAVRRLFGAWAYGHDVCGMVGIDDCFTIAKINQYQSLKLLCIFSMLSSQAIYALGSTVWLKNAFLKTLGTLWVLQFVLGFVFGFVSSWIVNGVSVEKENVLHMMETGPYILYAAFAITTVFCYVTAYFRMREEELITRM